MSILLEKLKDYANHNCNVLLIGTHGIGKTTLVKQLSEELNMKLKYYSSSTLDPWADLVGVPVPNNQTKSLEFYRPFDLEDAEFVFFDELNRAHPRVLNAVLEIIQFKSINGKKLPKLRMVWAAINPPGGEYQVEDLDPALYDRFHVYIKMKPEINLEYMNSVMTQKTAKALHDWWNNDCDDRQRELLTPRRAEYIGVLIEKGIPWRDAIPQGHTFPTQDLAKRLESIDTERYSDINVTKEDIMANSEKYIKQIKDDPSVVFKLQNHIIRLKVNELYDIKDLLELLPPDIINEIAKKRFIGAKRKLKAIFEQDKVDLTKYPKIQKAFNFDNI